MKIKNIFIILPFLFNLGCSFNQLNYDDITKNSYEIIFDEGVPKDMQNALNSILKSSRADSNNLVKVEIKNFMYKEYDLYAGDALRSLETEVKSSIELRINSKKIINKKLSSMKRFNSNELNPLADSEMKTFIKRELYMDLINQLVMEVALIDL
tara:strand:- start:1034 stop:1495 length:462 start_codon:yes stop_codon:yes gene_type:complete